MADNAVSISDLIRRARQYEARAIDQLLESYRHYLRLLARTGIDASLQGKADPSDLVQETFLKADQHFGQFHGRGETELTAWLTGRLEITFFAVGGGVAAGPRPCSAAAA